MCAGLTQLQLAVHNAACGSYAEGIDRLFSGPRDLRGELAAHPVPWRHRRNAVAGLALQAARTDQHALHGAARVARDNLATGRGTARCRCGRGPRRIADAPEGHRVMGVSLGAIMGVSLGATIHSTPAGRRTTTPLRPGKNGRLGTFRLSGHGDAEIIVAEIHVARRRPNTRCVIRSPAVCRCIPPDPQSRSRTGQEPLRGIRCSAAAACHRLSLMPRTQAERPVHADQSFRLERRPSTLTQIRRAALLAA